MRRLGGSGLAALLGREDHLVQRLHHVPRPKAVLSADLLDVAVGTGILAASVTFVLIYVGSVLSGRRTAVPLAWLMAYSVIHYGLIPATISFDIPPGSDCSSRPVAPAVRASVQQAVKDFLARHEGAAD